MDVLSLIPPNQVFVRISPDVVSTAYSYFNQQPIQIQYQNNIVSDMGRTVEAIAESGLDGDTLRCFEPLFLKYVSGFQFDGKCIFKPTEVDPRQVYNDIVSLAYACYNISSLVISEWCLISSLHGVNADPEINKNLLHLIETNQTKLDLQVYPDSGNPVDEYALLVTSKEPSLKIGYVPRDEFDRFYQFSPLIWNAGATGKILRMGTFMSPEGLSRCYCVALIYRP